MPVDQIMKFKIRGSGKGGVGKIDSTTLAALNNNLVRYQPPNYGIPSRTRQVRAAQDRVPVLLEQSLQWMICYLQQQLHAMWLSQLHSLSSYQQITVTVLQM